MTRVKTIVLYCLLFLPFFQTNAQTEKENSSLIDVLDQINQKFGYTFSYVDKDIQNVTIVKPSDSLNFDDTIIYLETTTPFTYTILNDHTVALNIKQSLIEICGIITDVDQKIVANASIQSKNYATISNSIGEFSIKISSFNETLIINHLGFQTKIVEANSFLEKECKNIMINDKIEYLNEIFLKDYLIKGINKQTDGSIAIDYDNFGVLPGLIEPDLLQTIQALPGISSVKETVSDINVRGGTNDQNLILWDGIKMYQSSHFFGLISAFNPYLTKNIKLFKNGSSATYGDGVSSVIAMNTDNTISKEKDVSIGVNLISADAYIDTPISKTNSLQFAIRHSINGILETPTYNKYYNKAFQNSEVINNSTSDDQFSFYDTSIRWLYRLSPKDLIKINALIMHNNLRFQENSSGNQISISRESSLKQDNNTGGILHLRDWSTNFQSKLLLYGTNYNLESINSDIENNQRLLQSNTVLENGLKVNTTYNIKLDFNLKNGYQFNETGISNLQDLNNPTFRDRIKEVIRTHSLFSELEYKSVSKNTFLNLGLRANYLEKFNKYTIEPRISFHKRFLKHFTLELLGEIKNQTTSQIIDLQNDFLGVENRRWILSNNKDIPIINSIQGSIGIGYNNHNWLINTDIYHKNVKGVITRSQGFQNQFEFIRDHGSYKVAGIDFLINKRFKKISAWFSYSYANNTYTFSNLSERNFPNNIDIRHNINFAASYSIESLKFSGGINWHSGKPITEPNAETPILNNVINYKNANSTRLSDYIRIDLSATYKFGITKKIKAFTGISIWNTLNQENFSNTYYKITNSNTIEEINQHGLAFTPNIVFRLNF